jgi:O-antigen biosynthesis protein
MGEDNLTKKIAWFIPYPTEGSGGHRTIFQNLQALVDNGYECHAYIEDNGAGFSSEELRTIIEGYFGKIDAQFFLGYDLKVNYDLIFATAWFTAKNVRDANQNCIKAYFIQDFEAYFNPMGDGYLLAENSYRYGLLPVTIGKWLSHKMKNEFNTPSNYFDFCADNKIYKKINGIKKEKAICFIHQPEKPRRCSIIGIEALGIVKHIIPDVKIYLYGSKSNSHVWFEHENLELINIEQCNELYNKCAVGLCISSSNPSRIPFEMMAAGLPVVDIYKDNNLYDMPDGGVILADQTPESIAKALIDILQDEEKQQKMSQYGLEFMNGKSLDYGFKQFVEAVDKMFKDNYNGADKIERIYNNKSVVADIYLQRMSREIIPVSSVEVKKWKQTKVYGLLRRMKRKIKKYVN